MKTALVLQGGGMRGVYTSGVLDQLMIEGIDFDAVYGVSAGAKNAQYFISKQIGEALKVDLFCANNKKAISIHNLIFEGGMISADYYNNFIMKEYAPLNDSFIQSPTKFYIGTTNVETGDLTYFEKSSCDVRSAVTASCSLPLVQQMVEINGSKYLDGGISEAIPYKDALENYQRVVIVLTRPLGYRASIDKKMDSICKLKYRKYPKLVEKITTQSTRFNEMMSEIETLQKEGKVIVISPTKPMDINMLEKDNDKLLKFYEMGKQDLIDQLRSLKQYLNLEE